MNQKITKETLERFWSKVKKTDTCWIWTGFKHKDGYGIFQLCHKNFLAHRFSYELTKGKIPNGLELDHLCRNRACVSPDHLEAVSHKVNILRGDTGIACKSKTHCPQGHPYDESNTYITPDGRRDCRKCRRLAYAKFIKKSKNG